MSAAVWVLAALVPAGAVGADCTGQDAAVRDVFNRYKAALMAGDGEAASQLVDRATLATFAELKRLARFGAEEEVRARPFVDRLLVVSMRHALEPEQLDGLDFAGLIETAMSAGWIQPAMIAGLDLGETAFDGEVASGVALNAAAPAPLAEESEAAATVRYRFVCEDGAWRFQFATLLEQLNGLVTELSRQMGADEDALLFALVEAFSGRAVLPDVWRPPAPEPEARTTSPREPPGDAP